LPRFWSCFDSGLGIMQLIQQQKYEIFLLSE